MLITNPKELERFNACHRIWQGIPSIARTKGGKTFLTFYSGATSETYGNYNFVIESKDAKTFGEPIAAAEKPGKWLRRIWSGWVWRSWTM